MRKKPFTLTSDRWTVTIAINREALERIDSTAAHLLLGMLEDEGGSGDWGGLDYPMIGLSERVVMLIVDAISSPAPI